jgi:hypothetical protein
LITAAAAHNAKTVIYSCKIVKTTFYTRKLRRCSDRCKHYVTCFAVSYECKILYNWSTGDHFDRDYVKSYPWMMQHKDTCHFLKQMHVGQMQVGQMPNCQMSVNHLSISQMPVCQMSVNQMFVGQMSVSQSVSQISVGQVCVGQVCVGQV